MEGSPGTNYKEKYMCKSHRIMDSTIITSQLTTRALITISCQSTWTSVKIKLGGFLNHNSYKFQSFYIEIQQSPLNSKTGKFFCFFVNEYREGYVIKWGSWATVTPLHSYSLRMMGSDSSNPFLLYIFKGQRGWLLRSKCEWHVVKIGNFPFLFLFLFFFHMKYIETVRPSMQWHYIGFSNNLSWI